MRTAKSLFLITAATLFMATAASAETRFIRDLVLVNLRAEPESGAESLKLMRTGDPMEVIEESGDFVFVRTEDGLEGWLPEQYTTPTEPASRKLAQLESALAAAREDLEREKRAHAISQKALDDARTQLEKEATTGDKALNEARSEAKRLSKELSAVTRELEELKEKSENVLRISQERDQLAAEKTQWDSLMAQANEQLESLSKMAMLKWFLGGGAVLFVGWMLGSAMGRKKRSKTYK